MPPLSSRICSPKVSGGKLIDGFEINTAVVLAKYFSGIKFLWL